MPYGSRRSGNDVVLESRHLVGLFVLMVVIFGVVFVLGYELGRNQYGEQVRAAARTDADKPTDVASATDTATAAQPVAPAPAKSSAPAKSAKNASADKPQVNAAGIDSVSGSGGPPANYDFYKLGQPNQPAANLTPAKNAVPAKTTSAAPKIRVAPANNSSAAAAPMKKSSSSGSQPATLDGPLIPRGSYMLQVAALNSEGDALALAQALQKKKFAAFVIPPSSDHYYRVQVGPYPDGKTAESVQKALDKAGFKAIIKH
jgi:cell division septation protein DedD